MLSVPVFPVVVFSVLSVPVLPVLPVTVLPVPVLPVAVEEELVVGSSVTPLPSGRGPEAVVSEAESSEPAAAAWESETKTPALQL